MRHSLTTDLLLTTDSQHEKKSSFNGRFWRDFELSRLSPKQTRVQAEEVNTHKLTEVVH